MTRLNHPGTSKHRPGEPGGGAGRARPRYAACLAVLAILLQTILPDFGMAARVRAQAQAATHEIHQGHADTAHTPPPLPDEREPAHEHGPVCPFCLALASHALAPDSGSTLVAPPVRTSAGPAVAGGIVPAQPFLTCLRPRAPPHLGRA